MVAVICQCLATPYNDFHVGGTYLAGNHLPIAVVFVMLVFIFSTNVLLKRLKPGTELQGSELLVIWGMMLVASGYPVLRTDALPRPARCQPVLLRNTRKRNG